MTDDLQRDVGRMEAELSALKFSLDGLRADLKEIKSDLSEVNRAFAEMRGGLKTLLGLAAVLGAAVGQLSQWLLAKAH